MNGTGDELRPLADRLYAGGLFPWLAVLAGALLVVLVVLVVAWRRRRRARPVPAPDPRRRALERLDRCAGRIDELSVHDFTIVVCDILRDYLVEGHGLPATRRTSQELLVASRDLPSFSEGERALLARFLEGADLIKFARPLVGPADSVRLLEQARAFVGGAGR